MNATATQLSIPIVRTSVSTASTKSNITEMCVEQTGQMHAHYYNLYQRTRKGTHITTCIKRNALFSHSVFRFVLPFSHLYTLARNASQSIVFIRTWTCFKSCWHVWKSNRKLERVRYKLHIFTWRIAFLVETTEHSFEWEISHFRVLYFFLMCWTHVKFTKITFIYGRFLLKVIREHTLNWIFILQAHCFIVENRNWEFIWI